MLLGEGDTWVVGAFWALAREIPPNNAALSVIAVRVFIFLLRMPMGNAAQIFNECDTSAFPKFIARASSRRSVVPAR